MSVQENHYTIVGAKFTFDEFEEKMCGILGVNEYDDIDEYVYDYQDSAFSGIHEKNGLCAIVDGMNGEHVYIGHVLFKSGNYGSINDFVNEKIEPTPLYIEHLIKREFCLDVECEIHSFTHYR